MQALPQPSHIETRNIIMRDIRRETWEDVVRKLGDTANIQTDEYMNEMDAIDDIALDFTLEELLPADSSWDPSPLEICSLLARELVEDAMVCHLKICCVRF